MSRAFTLGVVIGGLALLIAGSVGATRLRPVRVQSEANAQLDAEREQATRVGTVALDNVHRRELFEGYEVFAGGKTLAELAAETTNGYVRLVVHKGLSVAPPMNSQVSRRNLLADEAENADLVVQGTVIRQASHITAGGSFLFTDYAVQVTNVLKETPLTPVSPGETINTTRPGGRVLLEDILVIVIDENEPALTTGGDFVLFLKYVPEAQTYMASSTRGTFAFDKGNNMVRAVGSDRVARAMEGTAEAFLRDLRSLRLSGIIK
jgi:hypothetical protein